MNSIHASVAFPAAVAEAGGWFSFYEPQDHLTNGSLNQSFAELFSAHVKETMVTAVGPDFIEQLVDKEERVLLKIDVEGYEPVLLNSLKALIKKHQPDIILEVLSETEDEIRHWLSKVSYEASLFSETCLIKTEFIAKSRKSGLAFNTSL